MTAQAIGAAGGGGNAAAAGSVGASGGGAAATGNGGGAGFSNPDPELGIWLSAGQSHTCLARDGLVYCWGENRDGQLGSGDTERRLEPELVPGSTGVVQVSVGEHHTCWLNTQGTVSCFGSNSYGQLGQKDVASSRFPLEVRLPGPAAAIDVNYGHSCALLKSAALYCWGENVETQLGQGDAPDENHYEPIRVGELDRLIGVSCGQGHTLALRSNGDIYAWGRNTSGQIGQGEGLPVRLRVPTPITSVQGFETLDAGQDSACAIQSGGQLFCWGAGLDQHLGTQSDATVWAPVVVAEGPVWRSVSTDTFHTCALDAQDRLLCWGRAIEGQLGLGAFTAPQPEPSRLGVDSWQAVSVGRFHTCAVNVDQSVWCTGQNIDGQLGVGDTQKRNVLTQVQLPP